MLTPIYSRKNYNPPTIIHPSTTLKQLIIYQPNSTFTHYTFNPTILTLTNTLIPPNNSLSPTGHPGSYTRPGAFCKVISSGARVIFAAHADGRGAEAVAPF